MAKIIDGRKVATRMKENVAHRVAVLRDVSGVHPCLVAILVGNNPASIIYIRNKEQACKQCGIKFIKYELPETTSEDELLARIENANNDKTVHGILVQLPLPKHINVKKIINAINFKKDVDGFHPINVGKLSIGEFEGEERAIVPCTAKGCIKLIKTVMGNNLSGKKAIVIGRSNLVGRPTSCLLLHENCTVKIAHSKTKDLKSECLWADIVVVAIGKPKFIKADMIKKDAVVLDVGITKVDGKISGDTDFENVKNVAGYISPVPGGVGQMTVACLTENVLEACERLVK